MAGAVDQDGNAVVEGRGDQPHPNRRLSLRLDGSQDQERRARYGDASRPRPLQALRAFRARQRGDRGTVQPRPLQDVARRALHGLEEQGDDHHRWDSPRARKPTQQRVLPDSPRAAATLRDARTGARHRCQDARAHPWGASRGRGAGEPKPNDSKRSPGNLWASGSAPGFSTSRQGF